MENIRGVTAVFFFIAELINEGEEEHIYDT